MKMTLRLIGKPGQPKERVILVDGQPLPKDSWWYRRMAKAFKSMEKSDGTVREGEK